ncbi:hypothetical protein BDV18DRAFT_151478 [Aspergillus unguis]
MAFKSVVLAAALAALSNAQSLDKPALTSDLDYLLDGNVANLPESNGAYWAKWAPGLIPKDCKSIAEDQDLNATDFEVYDIYYNDCEDPWSFCRHKNSSDSFDTLIHHFGRVPVKMRSWVRHLLTIPGANWAFNSNGNIALSGTTDKNLDVILHETGHSLDLLGAYGDEALSSQQEWLDAYDADECVPDNYAQSSQVENVAQNTVVGIYDKNVPGGLPGIQPDYTKIEHQYSLLQDKAGDLIVQGGMCDRHLENSDIVYAATGETADVTFLSKRFARGVLPARGFKGEYNKVLKTFLPFDSREFH